MNRQPLVSVLMTSYNREKYIAYAIESVLASTYPNFELIIVDDASKDQTVAIAESFATKDKRIKVFINSKNIGDYPNRNKAASYAKGKYLKYVDADDYIYPWCIEVMVNMMEMHPLAGWGLCSSSQADDRPFPVLLLPAEAYKRAHLKKGLFDKSPGYSIIRTDVFKSVNGFNNLRMVGDFEMWHRLSLKHPVLMMPDGLVWYRVHSEQEYAQHYRYVVAYEKILVQYIKHPECPLIKKDKMNVIRIRKLKNRKAILTDLVKLRFSTLTLNLKVFRYYLSVNYEFPGTEQNSRSKLFSLFDLNKRAL
jgi:glycosyltransferase involved in cell wall biosynthesis